MSDTKPEKQTKRILSLTKHLPCKLTNDERLERGVQLAEVGEKIGNEEKRQVDVKAEMKARMTGLESESARLGTIVRRNEEYRDVLVQEIYDYERGTVVQVRTDTGEQIAKREMTTSERQEVLPFKDEKE